MSTSFSDLESNVSSAGHKRSDEYNSQVFGKLLTTHQLLYDEKLL